MGRMFKIFLFFFDVKDLECKIFWYKDIFQDCVIFFKYEIFDRDYFYFLIIVCKEVIVIIKSKEFNRFFC